MHLICVLEHVFYIILSFLFSPSSVDLLNANYIVGYTANVTELSVEEPLLFGLDRQDFITHQGIDFFFPCEYSFQELQIYMYTCTVYEHTNALVVNLS